MLENRTKKRRKYARAVRVEGGRRRKEGGMDERWKTVKDERERGGGSRGGWSFGRGSRGSRGNKWATRALIRGR